MGLNVSISHIVGSGSFDPRLKIEVPEKVTLIHDLTLESARDAAFILNDEFNCDYMDAVNCIKAAIRDTKYDVPVDTMEWANEK